MGNTTATMKRVKALKRARKQGTAKELEKAAHEYRLEQARELLRASGFVQGPGGNWTPATMGALGGKARAAKRTKKELSAIGKAGALARWGKKGGRP
jgi:hypothetical protein